MNQARKGVELTENSTKVVFKQRVVILKPSANADSALAGLARGKKVLKKKKKPSLPAFAGLAP